MKRCITKLTSINVLNHKNKISMTITINCNNPYRANRVHNYFYNKGVQVMLCNDETSVSLFNIDRDRAELLLAAFTKYFHLVSVTAHALAS